MRGIAVMAVLVAALVAPAVPAQYGPPPGGSYQQSCREVVYAQGVLHAACRRIDGSWQRTSLMLERSFDCAGHIDNIDGRLVCGVRGTYFHEQELPPGSYRETCVHLRLDNGALLGECRRRDQSVAYASMPDAGICADVVNDDGRLLCRHPRRAPPGSYIRSCNDIVVDWDDLRAECRTINQEVVGAYLRNFPSCAPGSISNQDGNLVCERQ